LRFPRDGTPERGRTLLSTIGARSFRTAAPGFSPHRQTPSDWKTSRRRWFTGEGSGGDITTTGQTLRHASDDGMRTPDVRMSIPHQPIHLSVLILPWLRSR
jgi:hypothetical protein